jgi:tyrosine-protein kinase Etk/Wzc
VAIAADKKSGLIGVMASDGDPAFAAQLANAQVEQLGRLMSRLAVTEAQQRRLFYEQQIEKTQKTLVDLDVRYRAAQQKTGIQMASSLAESDMQAGVSLRSQIAAKEIQLQSLSQFATRQNPEVVRLAGELVALRGQLQKYERGTGQSTATAPLQQEALQAFRELKTQEAMLDAFVRQLEVARIDEAKDGPSVQVVDLARTPELRAKPERKKMVIAYTTIGAVLGLFLASLLALLRYVKSTPGGALQWQQLKRAWLGWRR